MIHAARRWLRSQAARIVALIDSESVRPFQVFVYCCYAIAGVQSMRLGLPGPVANALGDGMHVVWTWMLVLGPVLTFVGMRLERRWVPGLWLQFTGDGVVGWASLTYVYSISQQNSSGRAQFAVYAVGSLTVAAFTMCIRDIRKIRRLVKGVRAMGAEQ